MKIFILSKKKLGITIVVIGLMLILFGIEKNFDEKLKFTALIQNNISSLKEYNAPELNIVYKLPEEWVTEERKFGGNEIIYHNDFQSKDFKIHGFVQVWNLHQDLKTFLEKSKKISDKQNLYKNYKLSPVMINDKDGYVVESCVITDKNVCYKGYEYFIRYNDKFYRFSFFVREDNFKENMPIIFKTIVETLKFK